MPADDVRGQGAALPLVFFILLVFAAALLLRAWGPALSEAMLRLSAALLRPLALFAPGYAEAAARISALDPGTVSPRSLSPCSRSLRAGTSGFSACRSVFCFSGLVPESLPRNISAAHSACAAFCVRICPSTPAWPLP